MALITCSECGRQISDQAPACPQCGCPGPSTPTQPDPSTQNRAQTDSPGPPFAIPSDLGVAPPDETWSRAHGPTRPARSPSALTRRPWFMYGCFFFSLGSAMICSCPLLQLIGMIADKEHAFRYGALVAVLSIPLLLFGVLDKYILRRKHRTIPNPALATMAGGLLCLGFLALFVETEITVAGLPAMR